MFEGCLQAMAVLPRRAGLHPRPRRLALRAGRRTRSARCAAAGRCTPASQRARLRGVRRRGHRRAACRRVYADLLCTVDGLKAFHARARRPARSCRTGRSTHGAEPCRRSRPPGSPRSADSRPRRAAGDRRRLRVRLRLAARLRLGPAVGRRSGRCTSPSTAPRRVARLPGPPYHFMTRIVSVEGADRRHASRAPTSRSSTTSRRTPGTSTRTARATMPFARAARGRAAAVRLARVLRRQRAAPPTDDLLVPQPRRHRHAARRRSAAGDAARCARARRVDRRLADRAG